MCLQLLVGMLRTIPGIRLAAVAQGVREAVQTCRSLPVDLLVLDLALPDGDGLELLKDVVRRRPEARLPSLRLSGDDSFRVVTHVGQATLRLAHVLLSAPLVRRWSPRGAARRR